MSAADTTVLGMLTDGNETASRGEVDHLTQWCHEPGTQFDKNGDGGG